MSASFDNLVARKGSPTHSLRSGSTNASSHISGETRDISRQSAQQARLNHRRAIQARKVVFLILILLVILGGLSYAIYRVVSNDSEETESTKIKLEKNDATSIHSLKASSIFVEVKTSTVQGI
jgi:Na+-transporting methylmalonyl-CoA/oxaloacetate decarboxylase gamma subunit